MKESFAIHGKQRRQIVFVFAGIANSPKWDPLSWWSTWVGCDINLLRCWPTLWCGLKAIDIKKHTLNHLCIHLHDDPWPTFQGNIVADLERVIFHERHFYNTPPKWIKNSGSHFGLLALPANKTQYAGAQLPARQEMSGFKVRWAHFEWMEYFVFENRPNPESINVNFQKKKQKHLMRRRNTCHLSCFQHPTAIEFWNTLNYYQVREQLKHFKYPNKWRPRI